MKYRSASCRGVCLLCLCLCLGLSVEAAEPKPGAWKGLAQMMSAEEFHAAGLDRLSPEELGRLDEWFLRFIAYDSQQIIKSDEKIKELQATPARYRIAGSFHGWNGDTVFRLDNGDVWKQRLPGRYAISLESPEVEIYKNLLGFYELRVVETGRKVGVSRLK